MKTVKSRAEMLAVVRELERMLSIAELKSRSTERRAGWGEDGVENMLFVSWDVILKDGRRAL